jgi:hypothetical protein
MSLVGFKIQYESAPIILVNGIAKNQVQSGGQMSILSLFGLLSGSGGLNLLSDISDPNSFSIHFEPIAGSSLEKISVATYPFANQSIAANAVIFEPLPLQLIMIAPAAASGGGYTAKSAIFTAMKQSLDSHIAQGGYFNVATPAYLYTSVLLTELRDITPVDERQKQITWQWDFIQPLLTLDQAAKAMNTLLSKAQAGNKITGDPPSQAGIIGGQSTGSGPATNQNLAAANASQPQPASSLQ